MIGVDMGLSEYQDYLGDEIVGYRFATIGTAYIYDVFILPISNQYLSTDNMIQWDLSDSEGYPTTYSTSGWHEVRLDTPIEFNFPDSIVKIWLGYEYYQPISSSSMNKTPVAYNSSSTSHMDRMYWNSGFYDMQSYIGGDIAVQLIMRKSVEKTPAPNISYVVNDNNVVITATGDGTVTLTIDGQTVTGNGSASITINRTAVDQTVTATATAQDGDLAESTPATQQITIPAITVPELVNPIDGSTVNVGTNDGAGVTKTITVTGLNLTEDLTVSVSGAGFSVSPTTISANDANNGTTITVTYNGLDANATGTLIISSDEVSATVNLTASFEAQAPILGGLLRLHLMMVDQFNEEIPKENNHPEAYGYVLKYEPEGGNTKQSGTVQVDIEKTKAKVNGYYTKAEIDNDINVDTTLLTLNVLTADVEMDLNDQNPNVLYFQMQGKLNASPTSDDLYLTKLQYMKNIRMYEEMEPNSPNLGHRYDPAEKHHYYHQYYDDSESILTAPYAYDYCFTYAPSVSTWGIQRRYFEDDAKDNTYGAPIWKTAVGAVEVTNRPAIQKQVINAGTSQEANNPNTTWTAGGKTYCLYFLSASAQAYMPKTSITNINYEPYMFRVFVSSPTGKLRKFKRELGDGGGYYTVDDGPATGKYCVGSFDINSGTWNATELFFNKGISSPNSNSLRGSGEDEFNPNAWDDIMKFGAEDGITKDDIQIYVRFYYMVEGWDATRDGEARPGNGTESDPGTPDNPSTFVYEYYGMPTVVGVTYVNAQGMKSEKPFDGLNIVVTRYSDGTTSTTKVIR